MPKLLIIFVFLFLSACSDNQSNDEIRGQTMGTTYTIKVQNFKIDRQQIERRLEKISSIFSNWNQNSEISTLNNSPANKLLAVSEEMTSVLKSSINLYQQTQGFFDPGIGRLIDVWGFGASKVGKKPGRDLIKHALEKSSIKHLELNKLTLNKRVDIHLNLSALVKGYAVDEIANLLEAQGVERFMVEIGGEIKARGDWSIGIETPTGQASIAIDLINESIATSGNYRNFFVWEGGRYAHILDPHTGLPVNSDLFSVSVIHNSNMMADAYATAMMAMGGDKAVKLAHQLNLKTVLILNNTDRQGLSVLSKNIIKIGL